MTTAEARRLIGNNYRIAQVLGIHRSTVGRWGRMVPKLYRETLQVALHAQCKSHGWQTPIDEVRAAIKLAKARPHV